MAASSFLAGALGALALAVLGFLYGLLSRRLGAELPLIATFFDLGTIALLAATAVAERDQRFARRAPDEAPPQILDAGFAVVAALGVAGWILVDMAFPDRDVLPTVDPLAWTFRLLATCVVMVTAGVEWRLLRRRLSRRTARKG